MNHLTKSFLSIAILLFSIVIAHGQTIIPKVGISFSKIMFDDGDDIDYKAKPGLVLGAAINYPVMGDMFSVQPEFLFIQKGSNQSYSFSDSYSSGTDKEKTTVNYVEVPVLAKASFGTGTKFHINAGPSFAFALSGKYKDEITEKVNGGQTTTRKTSEKIEFGKDGEKRLDIGFQFGGGVTIADKITIDLRYGLGLSNLNNQSNDDRDVFKNRVFQLTVGMPLAL